MSPAAVDIPAQVVVLFSLALKQIPRAGIARSHPCLETGISSLSSERNL